MTFPVFSLNLLGSPFSKAGGLGGGVVWRPYYGRLDFVGLAGCQDRVW